MARLAGGGHRSVVGSTELRTHRVCFHARAFTSAYFPLREDYRIDALLNAIKRPFSFKIKKALQAAGSPLLEKLTVRDRPGHLSFRYWQEGGGHDRNLVSTDKLIVAANYIHHNPVRRGLCQSPDRWKWSSWKFYHAPEKYALERLPRIHGFPA